MYEEFAIILLGLLALVSYLYFKLRLDFERRLREREEEIRKDAIERSTNAILGRVGEQLAPVLVFEKHGINPRDARFIGTPVDYVSFNGLSENNVKDVTFIEVKSGKTTTMTGPENQVRDTIKNKKVGWLQVNLKKE